MSLFRWWQRHFLLVELILAAVYTGAVAAWCFRFGGFEAVDAILGTNRPQVYGALASIFGSLLGFVIAAVAIVLGYAESERLQVVRESRYYDHLWDTFMAAIRALGLATVAALVGLILDRPGDSLRPVFLFVVYGTVLAILRLWRTGWVLEHVIRLITKR